MGNDYWPWTMLQLIDGEIVRTKVQPYLEPPHRCGTLTHDNVDTALHGPVKGLIPETTDLNWRGELIWTDGGTAIIDGKKPESTHHKVKD